MDVLACVECCHKSTGVASQSHWVTGYQWASYVAPYHKRDNLHHAAAISLESLAACNLQTERCNKSVSKCSDNTNSLQCQYCKGSGRYSTDIQQIFKIFHMKTEVIPFPLLCPHPFLIFGSHISFSRWTVFRNLYCQLSFGSITKPSHNQIWFSLLERDYAIKREHGVLYWNVGGQKPRMCK